MTHTPTALRSAAVVVVLTMATIAASGCGPRVEYHVRPGYATKADLPDEIVLKDGTIIRYLDVTEYIARQQAERKKRAPAADDADNPDGPEREEFIAWQEADDGSVRMKAARPDQLVSIVMRAFREERYGELWDQLVAKGVRERAAYDIGPEKAREQFIEWCAGRRTDVMTLLNRMSFAFSSNSVVYDHAPGVLRLRLAPQIKGDFKFRVFEVEYDSKVGSDLVFLGGIR